MVAGTVPRVVLLLARSFLRRRVAPKSAPAILCPGAIGGLAVGSGEPAVRARRVRPSAWPRGRRRALAGLRRSDRCLGPRTELPRFTRGGPGGGLGWRALFVALRAAGRHLRRRDTRGRALPHDPEEMPDVAGQRSPRPAVRRENELSPVDAARPTRGRIEARGGVDRVWLAEIGRTCPWVVVAQAAVP